MKLVGASGGTQNLFSAGAIASLVTTRNSNREEDLIEVETDSQTTSAGLLGTPVGPVPPETTPSTPHDALPDLAKAFGQLADSLNNTRKPSIQARVRELDQLNSSDTCKLQLFLTQCLLNFHNRPNTFSNDSAKVTYILSFLHGTALDWFEPTLTSGCYAPWLTDYSAFLSKCEGDAADKATIIDYSKTGANKR